MRRYADAKSAMAAASRFLKGAALSIWLEEWDHTTAPGPLVDGIADLMPDDLPRAAAALADDRRVQVDCPRYLLADANATAEFAAQAAARAHPATVAIGLPSTALGLTAAEELVRHGIGVGIGPVGTTATWVAVADAFMRGLERRNAAGLPLDDVDCVVWLPVGAIDAQSDRCLPPGSSLRGTAGIAIAQLLYLLAFRSFAQARWTALRVQGAQPPRLGWNRLTTERRASYISRLTLPGSVIALPHRWATEIEREALDVAEADETEADWTSRELVASGVPLQQVLVQVETSAPGPKNTG
jgi:transaldolase